jgi:hypothetical protein
MADPHMHTGEGIFPGFKAVEIFTLRPGGLRRTVDVGGTLRFRGDDRVAPVVGGWAGACPPVVVVEPAEELRGDGPTRTENHYRKSGPVDRVLVLFP